MKFRGLRGFGFYEIFFRQFNVKEWLRKKTPRLADRSQMVEVLSQALKEIGSQPAESLLYIHKVGWNCGIFLVR